MIVNKRYVIFSFVFMCLILSCKTHKANNAICNSYLVYYNYSLSQALNEDLIEVYFINNSEKKTFRKEVFELVSELDTLINDLIQFTGGITADENGVLNGIAGGCESGSIVRLFYDNYNITEKLTVINEMFQNDELPIQNIDINKFNRIKGLCNYYIPPLLEDEVYLTESVSEICTRLIKLKIAAQLVLLSYPPNCN